jgi:hypothetical protein
MKAPERDPEAPNGWDCELIWYWGAERNGIMPGVPLREIYRFWSKTRFDIGNQFKEIAKQIAKGHAFDCGRLDKPLNPKFSSLYIQPSTNREFIDAVKFQHLLDDAVEEKRKVLEADDRN